MRTNVFLTRALALTATSWLAACGGGASPSTSPTPQPTPSVSADGPPASAGHSLVYADHLESVIMVNAGLGGAVKPAPATPTRVWAWGGAEWRLLDSSGPPIRNLAGVTYDARRSTLVMHGGGYDLGRSYSDTWEWSAAGWRQVMSAGPGIRDHTQMAFDPDRGRSVLFGGSGENPNLAFSDTWEFDGSRWDRVATDGPPARIHHAMHFDRTSRRIVLLGGAQPGSGELGDSWAWDGSRWLALPPSITPRTHARMSFHAGLNALLVAGGFSTQGIGLLVRRDSGWAPLPLAGEPSTRYLTDMAYDTRRGVLVLFGGGDPSSSTLYSDTWEFNGTTWRRVR
jgi:hypothetical protein